MEPTLEQMTALISTMTTDDIRALGRLYASEMPPRLQRLSLRADLWRDLRAIGDEAFLESARWEGEAIEAFLAREEELGVDLVSLPAGDRVLFEAGYAAVKSAAASFGAMGRGSEAIRERMARPWLLWRDRESLS